MLRNHGRHRRYRRRRHIEPRCMSVLQRLGNWLLRLRQQLQPGIRSHVQLRGFWQFVSVRVRHVSGVAHNRPVRGGRLARIFSADVEDGGCPEEACVNSRQGKFSVKDGRALSRAFNLADRARLRLGCGSIGRGFAVRVATVNDHLFAAVLRTGRSAWPARAWKAVSGILRHAVQPFYEAFLFTMLSPLRLKGREKIQIRR